MTTARRAVASAIGALLAGSALVPAGAAERVGLRAEDLLLLVNQNVPDSADVAAHYAAARHVPAERLLRLDVPPGEEISAADYDARIAGPVRAYLRSPAGEGVRCVVTFYGLPLRVGGRAATPAERQEAAALERVQIGLDRRVGLVVKAMEASAAASGVALPPAKADGVAAGRERIKSLEQAMTAAIAADPPKQAALTAGMKAAQQQSVTEAVAALEKALPSGKSPAADPAALQAALNHPRDAASRDLARKILADRGGIFALHQAVEQQVLWLNGDESDAAVDNELALVKLDDFYRYRWQANPFNYQNARPAPPSVVMTARIDAPTPEIAMRIIDDALKTEAVGLDGRAVFDSRGLPATKQGKPDGYGLYDELIRDAAALVKGKTKLDVVTDDREQVMLPHTVDHVAVYCGWYSLRNYIPSCTFETGAVAYHVASFELVTLHGQNEKGWVANLLRDKVTATLGPVSEPYLASFPRPDEFLPLVLTGRLTLAEAYWKTTPMTSWKQTLIGDPLYRPYAKHPAMTPDALPAALRAALTD